MHAPRAAVVIGQGSSMTRPIRMARHVAEAQGASPKLFCTAVTVTVLNGLPQASRFGSSFFPEHLRRRVARRPEARSRYRCEQDRGRSVVSN